ncbi:MAG: hypothetical protein JSV88_28955 [Candidatus Aminicenantes bacterium]|nr:MAG: hypothetical protein JSV88_28955 [Candidatus Aminicenantes bacterium]
MINLNRVINFFLLAFFLSCYFFGSPQQHKGSTTASYATEEGVHVVTFKTPYGSIYLNLPDDMAKGDIISGKLTLEPDGRKEKEKAKNRESLKDYILEIGERKTPAGKEWDKWTISNVKELPIILRSPKGKKVAGIQVPVIPGAPVSKIGDFQCPKAGLAGGLIEIPGPFDGDFSNTEVHIGDKELEKWAESPRKVILASPKDVVGSSTISLKEGSDKDECEYRNLLLESKVGKSKLLKGETTVLTIIVRGLEGLEDEIPFQIENKTPRIVSMEKEGSFFIQPDDVQPGGVYIADRLLTGITPGRFHISVSVSREKCTHCTLRYSNLQIISDDCSKVKFTVFVEHCNHGKWEEQGTIGGTKPKVPPYPDKPEKCDLVIHFRQFKDAAQYTLQHYNGKRWVYKTTTRVDKGKDLPASGKDNKSFIVRRAGKEIFFHWENGAWVKKGEWKE